jgi:uncharacterized protein HemY
MGDLAAAEDLFRKALDACRSAAQPRPSNEAVDLLAGILERMPNRAEESTAAHAEAAKAHARPHPFGRPRTRAKATCL